jgi:uncharacterized protein
MPSKPRAHDPRHVDVAVAAADAAVLAGEQARAEFERLGPPGDHDSAVRWRAAFSQTSKPGAAPQARLRLEITACLTLECQRCLGPAAWPIEIERALRFAPDEATAAALDADSEDDILALDRRFDLVALVEDELLLALPLVPRHEHCPEPLVSSHTPTQVAVAGEASEGDPHPFAALAALKRGANG